MADIDKKKSNCWKIHRKKFYSTFDLVFYCTLNSLHAHSALEKLTRIIFSLLSVVFHKLQWTEAFTMINTQSGRREMHCRCLNKWSWRLSVSQNVKKKKKNKVKPESDLRSSAPWCCAAAPDKLLLWLNGKRKKHVMWPSMQSVCHHGPRAWLNMWHGDILRRYMAVSSYSSSIMLTITACR